MKMKRAIAVLLALAMIFSLVGCGAEKVTTADIAKEVSNISDQLDNLISVVENNGSASSGGVVTPSGDDDTAGDGVVIDDDNAADPAATDASGDASSSGGASSNSSGSSSSSSSSSKKPNSTSTGNKMPTTTADILALYNKATNLVVSSKPGYTKNRASVLGNYKAGAILSVFKGIVLEFMGVGEENEFNLTVAKGSTGKDTKDSEGGNVKFAAFNASTLAASNVKSAKCTKSGNNYVIEIQVKDGTSSVNGGASKKNNSPIDKCGIVVGDSDRSEFDHKTAEIIYAAIEEIASEAVISEKTSNCKVVATINASTNKMSKLVVTFTADVSLSKVKGSSATISGTTTVTYSNFKW